MALAALWVLPVAFAIVGFSAKIQENLNQKAMDVKMACADGIQECIETVRDLKANNAEQAYLKGLEKKIRAVEHRSILNEFGLAVFVVSASLVLSLVLQRLRWWELFCSCKEASPCLHSLCSSGSIPFI